MRLTKLELSGFKSFADTITVHFDEGVTAIVGPNGCGKSNVSDAVRWVLGAQSARLLRGGKMEDVIFQGASGRRAVNVAEASLFLDNSEGLLPIAYQEVQITRRLSRSGQSDYLLNRAPVRLRDVHDLLRGTGLGSDAGVVIEAKMIDLLLSDRASERRSLFEEAAGIGLYRDRKHSTERRLEETALDLQRVEDLIAEVQSQIRSLARQKGKAERHNRLQDEKFSVELTLARRELEALATSTAGMKRRHEELVGEREAARRQLAEAEERRQERANHRTMVEAQRTDIARRLSDVQVEVGRLDGELAVAGERLANAAQRRQRASEERLQQEAQANQAARDVESATEVRSAATVEFQTIEGELRQRAETEAQVRATLSEQRDMVRTLEQQGQHLSQRLKSLEGERGALEEDLASLREQVSSATGDANQARSLLGVAKSELGSAQAAALQAADGARTAAGEADRRRHVVSEAREFESSSRAALRRTEETLAQLSAREQALQELEQGRVGLAPGATALLAERDRFGEGVLGPLSDFVRTGQDDAVLAERLLGEWVHAVLVRDEATVAAVRAWHAEANPGTLVLLPGNPPAAADSSHPLRARATIESPLAASWVANLLAGTSLVDDDGAALVQGNGAVLLSPAASPSGPLQRRAELETLARDVAQAQQAFDEARSTVAAAQERLSRVERELAEAATAAEEARDAERDAAAVQTEGERKAAALTRDLQAHETQLGRLTGRVEGAEARITEIDHDLTTGEAARTRTDEELDAARSRLAELESEQDAAREARVHWQVQAAHVEARLKAAQETFDRADRIQVEARSTIERLTAELAQLESDSADTTARQTAWKERRAECRVAVLELEAARNDAEAQFQKAERELTEAEEALTGARTVLDDRNEEHHALEIRLTEAAGERRGIIERVETEWRKSFDTLMEGFEPLDLELATLREESTRIRDTLEKIGPVNPLAVEEHAEESKRLEFLSAQRDDLVAARLSLVQAIREIDATAKALFTETFAAIRGHFMSVFQTLFGGGECDLRLTDEDDPLESEIEIHAAPRGKRTQRIHLLSSGERTLVAVSLLFGIYLTKPSPFCLMDEVDAPLDDANVGRFTRMLDEFKKDTQFIVITHNPRTMHAADAIYGVTMQEPGVSTIVGVRLTDHLHPKAPAASEPTPEAETPPRPPRVEAGVS
jgi:chromosome segregation protein